MRAGLVIAVVGIALALFVAFRVGIELERERIHRIYNEGVPR